MDHQVVNLEFENQVNVSFVMSAFTNQCAREIRIMGTKGEITGNMEAGEITITDFLEGHEEKIRLHTPKTGHSGSDMRMMKDFVRLVALEGEKRKPHRCPCIGRKSPDRTGSRKVKKNLERQSILKSIKKQQKIRELCNLKTAEF